MRFCEDIRIFPEYLSENELLSQTILAWLSGAQMASIHEIKNAKKSRHTAPLRLLEFKFIWNFRYIFITF